MPYHPKTKHEDKASSRKSHGPMQRTGKQAEDWDKYIGPSLDSIPATQLPTVRSVLQRYRALRIDAENAPRLDLAHIITTEVINIWDKARIPTGALKNTTRKTVGVIDWWKPFRAAGEHGDEIEHKLSSLFDIKPMLKGKLSDEGQLENLKSLM